MAKRMFVQLVAGRDSGAKSEKKEVPNLAQAYQEAVTWAKRARYDIKAMNVLAGNTRVGVIDIKKGKIFQVNPVWLRSTHEWDYTVTSDVLYDYETESAKAAEVKRYRERVDALREETNKAVSAYLALVRAAELEALGPMESSKFSYKLMDDKSVSRDCDISIRNEVVAWKHVSDNVMVYCHKSYDDPDTAKPPSAIRIWRVDVSPCNPVELSLVVGVVNQVVEKLAHLRCTAMTESTIRKLAGTEKGKAA